MKGFASLKLAAVVAGVFAVGMAQAQVNERTFRIAINGAPGHPTVVGAEKWAELINKKSGGKMTLKVFPSTLGGDVQVLSAVQGGTIDFASMNSGILQGIQKEFAIFDLPFMFGSGPEADKVLDGPFGKKLADLLPSKNLYNLAYWELGFRNITNSRRPINKVEDIAGLKLRVIPNAINVDWVSALGANPTPLAFPEVYAAMEQKAIDGHENPFSVINANKFFEVQKHLAVTNHQYNPQAVIVSKKLWDSLSADEKKIFDEAAVEATKFQRQFNREQMGVALDNLKKNGMQVTEFNAAEMAKFRDKMKPVIDKHSAIVGPDVVNALQAELGKLRGGK